MDLNIAYDWRPGIFKKMKFFIAETRILNIFES